MPGCPARDSIERGDPRLAASNARAGFLTSTASVVVLKLTLRASAHLALAVLLCAFAACGRARPKVVVWIEVDTLRADALGCYGNTRSGENGVKASPHIDALAADGVRFANAVSAAPWTIPSFVTQLSGEWPWEHGCTRLLETVPPAYTPLVPSLRARGWRTAGVMTNFIAKQEYGFANGFERWDETLAQGHEGSTSHTAIAKLLAFADEAAKDPGQGVFLFGWLFEPHYRYEEHAGLRFGPGYGDMAQDTYTGPLHGDEELDDLLRRRKELSPADAVFLRGRYQSEVAYVDQALGDLVAGLKARGLYDDALIVFASDHGEEILERGWIGHSISLHGELVNVPLIFKLPRGIADARRGSTVGDGVSLIDLPATLVDLMTGSEPDRSKSDLAHSRSLVPTLVDGEPPARRRLYLHTNFEPVLMKDVSRDKSAHQWGVIDVDRKLKWIVDHKVPAGAEPRCYLYDLARDPLEKTNLASSLAGVESALSLRLLNALVPKALDGRRPAPPMLPEEPWIRAPQDADGLGPAWPAGGK
jgi:arylsulfatase A-like enzyme